jgi:hypothetical protein
MAEAMQATLLFGLLDFKKKQKQAHSSQQQQQLGLQEFGISFAGSWTDQLLRELPRTLTVLSLTNRQGGAACDFRSSTLAAFTRLRSLKINLEAGIMPPLHEALPALQQLQTLSVVVGGSDEELQLLQQRLPQQLQHLTLIWWQPPVGVEWEERYPPLQLQQLTGKRNGTPPQQQKRLTTTATMSSACA